MNSKRAGLSTPWSFHWILLLGFVAGCGSGSPSSPAIAPTLTITPSTQLDLDSGQSVTLAGLTNNDPDCDGVSWVLNSVGTLGTPVTVTQGYTGCLTSVAYTAPTGITVPTTITLTATTVRTPVQTATVTITINATFAFTSSATIATPTIVGVPYSTTVTTSGGSTPITFAATGTTPPGLSFSSAPSTTGAANYSGTPTTAGSYKFSFTAKDSSTTPLTITQSGVALVVDPAISTTSLANAVVGISYSQPIAVAGAGTTVTYSLATGSGPLPPGLAFTSTGIAGTPTGTGGVYSFSVIATTNGEPSAAIAYKIAVFTTSPLPTALAGGVVNTAYSQQLTAGGASGAPYTITEAGQLPSGISFANGLLSGTPAQAGNTPFTITLTDSAGDTVSIPYEFTVTALPFTCTPSTLPNGATSVSYNQTIACTGGPGTAPTFTLTSGTLPNGLTLGQTAGTISGTPALSGIFTFTISATEQTTTTPVLTYTANMNYTVTIAASTLAITTTTLPNGMDGASYYQPINYTGGSGGTATWLLTVAPTVPPTGPLTPSNADLTLTGSGNNGTYSGTLQATPLTNYGTFTVTITLTVGAVTGGGGQQQVSVTIPLTVTLTPLVITTTSLPNAVVGYAYNQQLAYTGGPAGNATVTWAYAPGSATFPSPLTLSTTGVVSNTPASTFPTTTSTQKVCVIVTVTVTGAAGITSPQQCYNPFLVASFAITSPNDAYGEVNLAFSFPLTGLGGAPPYTWSIPSSSPNQLPAGLQVVGSEITGTPTTATATTGLPVTLQAMDQNGSIVTETLTFYINPTRSSANNSQLNGQYAFLLSGFDSNHNPLTVVGELTANGAGQITGGTIDANGTSLPSPESDLTLSPSTYVLGPDNRGTLTLTSTSSAGTFTGTFVIAMGKASNGVSSVGYMTELDSSGQSLTGNIALQNPAAFSTSSVTGGFAFGLSGFQGSASSHAGIIGEMQLSAGKVNSSEMLNSTLTTTPVTSTAGTYTVSSSSGRGTLSLTIAGASQTFVFYVVSAQQLYIISSGQASGSSAATLLSGQAQAQTILSGSFTAASLTGTAVERLTRTTTVTSGTSTTYVPYAQVGVYTFDGVSKATVAYDQNTGGVSAQQTGHGIYTVATNGRVTAPSITTGANGCADCTEPGLYMYLSGVDRGFQMDFNTGIDTGTIEPQSTITSTSFNGTYVSGTVMPVSQSSIYATATLTASGAGVLTITEDISQDSTLLQEDVPISATYSVGTNGRVAVTASGTSPVYYLVSPTRAFAIDLSSSQPILTEINQ